MPNAQDWHPWFAWYPVRLWRFGDDYWRAPRAWLRRVECRIVGAIAPNGDLTDYWEYREPQPSALRPGWNAAIAELRSGRHPPEWARLAADWLDNKDPDEPGHRWRS
jgi:hypothetical protein